VAIEVNLKLIARTIVKNDASALQQKEQFTEKLLLRRAYSLFVAGLLLAHAGSFSTNYPPSARFFNRPL